MRFIQCFPLYKPVALKRLLNQAINTGAEILLDLEDSIQDTIDPANNLQLKQNARETLLALQDLLAPLSKSYPVHIRINHSGTTHFNNDLHVLAGLPEIIWQSIFIPKTAGLHDIQEVERALIEGAVNYKSLSPIIETKQGLGWLLNEFKQTGLPLAAIYFGNYDYNLSCNNWPIIEQDDDEYWQLAALLIQKAESLGYSYGNSPFANLRDADTMHHILARLTTLCSRPFYQVTLNNGQSKCCRQFTTSNELSYATGAKKPVQRTAADFLKYKLQNRGFAFNHNTGKLITPHEYLLSVNQNAEP